MVVRLKYIFVLFFGIAFFSCKGAKKTDLNVPLSIVDYFSSEKRNISSFKFESVKYILLNDTNSNALFGRIDKMLVRNDRIYILDSHLKILLVYDMNGTNLGRIGIWGQGPNEYVDIVDFDVDKNNNVYLLDGRLDKLMEYDSNGNIRKSFKLPFEADVLQVLGSNEFMFGLSSWNHGKNEGTKIIITDSTFNTLSTCLKYDEFVDPSYWFSRYYFIRTDKNIIYNQPIDDNIYVFSLNGTLSRIVKFDFKSKKVPNEYKKDIEPKLIYFDDFCFLKKFSVVTDKFILGTLWDKKETRNFIFDIKNNVSYISDVLEDSDRSNFTGYSDSELLSYIDPDDEMRDENLPANVIDHLKLGGFVVVIKSLC